MLLNSGERSLSPNLTLESYNRQLIRHTNLWAKLISNVLSNNQKSLFLLSIVPKDYSMIDAWRSTIDFQS